MSKGRQNSAFQRSRRQIVAVVMAAFLLLFVGTLAMIYVLSYQELYQENLDMLETYVEQYRENGNPSPLQDEGQSRLGGGHPERDEPPDHDSTRYLLSAFYSVAFDGTGQVSSVDLGSGTLYTESQLSQVAEHLLETGRTQGTYGNFVYCIDQDETYTLVALMDNTLVSDSFTTLFRNALLLGAVMVVVLFLCATALARWIIRPLEESDRRQRQFLSDAGHELKTPVAVVEANAELLEREVGENKWLRNIRSESSRMAGLVSELLTLVRTEQEPPQMEPLDFSRLVLGGVLPFESVAFELERKLDCRIDENITIQGNPGQLSQLVSILMDNALSHSDGAGDIAIDLHREKAGALLTVSNPGFIPEQDRAEIFARFFRSDSNRSDTGHYGLGLTIAQNIVTAHRGEIAVACSHGRVCFSVRLPGREEKRRTSSGNRSPQQRQ
ncbi:MAG: HAMP domain-containing histidine kinase [Clostridiales bacterium]|nr:HAMP domain-containing histidine kinase [Clostridiales bacterium]